jgi:CheY-like chemotaxis protein
VASSQESHRQAEEIINDPELISAWDANPLDSQLLVALVESGILTKFQLKKLARRRKEGESLLDTFLGTGTITEEGIAEGLAEHYYLPYLKLGNLAIEPELFDLVDKEFALQHTCVPLRIDRDQLTLALHNPLDFTPIDRIEKEKGISVKVVISSRSEILRLVETHYGMVTAAQSKPPSAPSQPPATKPSLGHSPPLRMLILEDEAIVRKLISLFLTRLEIGSEMEFAENSLEAFDKIRTQPPHLILMDLHMRDLDGFQFMKNLKADLATASIPVVLMTSEPPQQGQQLAKDLGADACLSKPIKPQEFETNLRSILSRIYGL